MVDTKILELPVATAIASPDVAPIVQGGITKQADVSLFGSPYIASHIARVDPTGSDATGTLGNSTRPFKTVQAALDAIVAAPILSVVDGFVDIGANNYSENLSIDLTGIATAYISFRGVRGHGSGDYRIFNSLEIIGGGTTEIYCENCVTGGGDITSSGTQLFLYAHNVDFSGCYVTFTGSGTCSVGSRSNSSGGVGQINADFASQITVFGLWGYGPTVIASAAPNGPDITLYGCTRLQIAESNLLTLSQFSIDAPESTVIAIQSYLKDLNCNGATFVDARISGTVTIITPIVYQDVFLDPSLMDFSTLPTTEPSTSGAAWIDTTGGLNIVKVHL